MERGFFSRQARRFTSYDSLPTENDAPMFCTQRSLLESFCAIEMFPKLDYWNPTTCQMGAGGHAIDTSLTLTGHVTYTVWLYRRLVPMVVETMKDAFPELEGKQQFVTEVILDEELSFGRTLKKGPARRLLAAACVCLPSANPKGGRAPACSSNRACSGALALWRSKSQHAHGVSPGYVVHEITRIGNVIRKARRVLQDERREMCGSRSPSQP